jgi:hypothetical protein
MEDALVELIKAVKPTLDNMDEERIDGFFYQIFLIVARGPYIAFFSYYTEPYHQVLDQYRIPHFRGCVSVTETHDHLEQDRYGREILFPDEIPNDLINFFHDDEDLNGLADPVKQAVRDDAQRYGKRCVFDVGNPVHRNLANKILYCFSIHTPRILQ